MRYQSCGLALLNTFYAQKHIPAGDMEEFLAQRHLKVPEEVRAGWRIVTGFTRSYGHWVFHTCTEGSSHALSKSAGTRGMLLLMQCHNGSTHFQAAYARE